MYFHSTQRALLFITTLVHISAVGSGLPFNGLSYSAVPKEAASKASPRRQRFSDKFKFPWPKTLRPRRGRREPGGGLSGSDTKTACPDIEANLVALVPPESQGITASQQPTFWFHIPYASSSIRLGEFSVDSRDSLKQIYHAEFDLPETPGWVSVQMPKDTGALLKNGQAYHWYFNLYCQDNDTTKPDFEMDGWVQRMPEIDPAWYSYDKTDHLARNLKKNSQFSKQARAQWSDWLTRLELDMLISAPIVGPVILIKNPAASGRGMHKETAPKSKS